MDCVVDFVINCVIERVVDCVVDSVDNFVVDCVVDSVFVFVSNSAARLQAVKENSITHKSKTRKHFFTHAPLAFKFH